MVSFSQVIETRCVRVLHYEEDFHRDKNKGGAAVANSDTLASLESVSGGTQNVTGGAGGQTNVKRSPTTSDTTEQEPPHLQADAHVM